MKINTLIIGREQISVLELTGNYFLNPLIKMNKKYTSTG